MISEKIKKKLKEAMKSRNKIEMTVLRDILTGFTNKLIEIGKTPQDVINDVEALCVIKRLAKQRKDSIKQFEKAGRSDLAGVEKAEFLILEEYIPQMMSKEDITTVAISKKRELNIKDKAKIGVLIGAVMKELKDKADGSAVKEVVEGLFGSGDNKNGEYN